MKMVQLQSSKKYHNCENSKFQSQMIHKTFLFLQNEKFDWSIILSALPGQIIWKSGSLMLTVFKVFNSQAIVRYLTQSLWLMTTWANFSDWSSYKYYFHKLITSGILVTLRNQSDYLKAVISCKKQWLKLLGESILLGESRVIFCYLKISPWIHNTLQYQHHLRRVG